VGIYHSILNPQRKSLFVVSLHVSSIKDNKTNPLLKPKNISLHTPWASLEDLPKIMDAYRRTSQIVTIGQRLYSQFQEKSVLPFRGIPHKGSFGHTFPVRSRKYLSSFHHSDMGGDIFPVPFRGDIIPVPSQEKN
jgi:ssDNA-specific exonuclease RecJ